MIPAFSAACAPRTAGISGDLGGGRDVLGAGGWPLRPCGCGDGAGSGDGGDGGDSKPVIGGRRHSRGLQAWRSVGAMGAWASVSFVRMSKCSAARAGSK